MSLLGILFYAWCIFCVGFIVIVFVLAVVGAIISAIDDFTEPKANKIARKKIRKAELEEWMNDLRLAAHSKTDFAISHGVAITRSFNMARFELDSINEWLRKNEELNGKN